MNVKDIKLFISFSFIFMFFFSTIFFCIRVTQTFCCTDALARRIQQALERSGKLVIEISIVLVKCGFLIKLYIPSELTYTRAPPLQGEII